MASSAPSSPLRSEDLLSESSEAPGPNQVSSEVTAQLYTSLHLSRQAEATARAQLYLPSTSSPPPEALDGLAQELSRSLSVGLENNLKKKVRDVCVLKDTSPLSLTLPGCHSIRHQNLGTGGSQNKSALLRCVS